MQDPFYVVKEEVVQSVNGARTLYGRWQELLDTTNTAEDEEFKWTTHELKRGNRAKFRMNEQEVADRRKFVTDTRATVAQMKKDIDNPVTRAKVERDQRSSLIPTTMGTPRTSREKLEAAIRDDNEAFIQAQQVRQTQMRQEEEEHLDHLEKGLGKLSEMSLTIHEELEDQDELLDKFQNEVASTTNRVSAGIKKISELIDRSSSTLRLSPSLVASSRA
ncbi:syntaxin 6, putative [Acanthamoeba castellanii str. Neff]|uniref:Syntaxin 6, putative n=1 Tax=Acanthamoeba castellanii (strain ATCC 30010 / Neff) TaxID=1257118 RepID=L8GXE5_ACACF|nr:syntaxin 6, putative [Acanthamoeba castellanii str. Neff]ELR16756.1 syntaxin 6, putative [Acanthamoeba castellanii str. Neff]